MSKLVSVLFRRNLGFFFLTLLFSSVACADVPKLTVDGNKIKANGQVVSLSGMSLFWSNTFWGGEKFFNAQAISAVKSKFGANLIRVPMGVEADWGYLQEPEANEQRVIAAVDAAIANDMYVIIDWHSHKAELYTSEAVDFFKRMANRYGNNNHVIYEIYNEPLNVNWSSVIRPYAKEVIQAIRSIDPDNLIVVGTPQWSQKVIDAANDPLDEFDNIAYTLHFYSGTHKQWLRDNAVTAMNKGIALFVTEWGAVNADGDGGVDYAESDKWVTFMKQHDLSNANWSLNDKVEGASALKPGASTTGNWSSSDYTASGNYAKGVISNWAPLPSAPSSSGGSNVGKEYNWNSGSEPSNFKHVSESVSSGRIKLTLNSANNDPYMRLLNTNVNGDTYTHVEFRVKNNTSGSAWRIYFNPNGKGEGGNSRAVSVGQSNTWKTYTVDMRGDADWSGNIKTIRIDPQGYKSGTVEFDYVKVISNGSAPAPTTTSTLNASADSFIRSGNYGNNNYGSNTSLDMKHAGGSFNREAVFKFNRSSISGNVISAKLRVRVSSTNTTATSTTAALYKYSSGWNEGNITHNNAPNKGSQIKQFSPKTAGQWIEIDVTSYFNSTSNQSNISFAIANVNGDSKSNWSVYSRETSSRPQLVITK